MPHVLKEMEDNLKTIDALAEGLVKEICYLVAYKEFCKDEESKKLTAEVLKSRNSHGITKCLEISHGYVEKGEKSKMKPAIFGRKYSDKKITDAFFDKEANEIRIDFEDGIKIKITDDGQSCCEERYLRTDDDLYRLIGQKFNSVILKTSASSGEDYGCHDVKFMEIYAGHESVNFSAHNEHNGYYGGIDICVTEIDDAV